MRAGGIKCWGYNDTGALGNGTTTESTVPVAVPGLAGAISAIAGGFGFTCAAAKAGGVSCWGYNVNGQLGDGTTNDSVVPVKVSGLADPVTAIAAGSDTSSYQVCALTSIGGVVCWGNNLYGQLGNGTTTASSKPVPVLGLASGATSIAAGDGHACAVTKAGGVVCWGYDVKGQLGNGTMADSSAPTAVSGLGRGVIAVTAGSSHTCALTSAGGVKCWGANDAGQLGDGSTTNSSTPVDVWGLTGVTAIAAGNAHTCALTRAGGVKCWGANAYTGSAANPGAVGGGQLGNGTVISSSVPVDVIGLSSGVEEIAAGGVHTCALTKGGGVMCWGSTGHGELTNPETTDGLIPIAVPGL